MAEVFGSEAWAWKTSWKRWAVEVKARRGEREYWRGRRFRDGLTRRPCRPSRC
jgi:hypothetical protein